MCAVYLMTGSVVTFIETVERYKSMIQENLLTSLWCKVIDKNRLAGDPILKVNLNHSSRWLLHEGEMPFGWFRKRFWCNSTLWKERKENIVLITGTLIQPRVIAVFFLVWNNLFTKGTNISLVTK